MPALLFHSTHLEWHLLVLCQHYYSTPHIWNDIFLYYASTTIPLHTSGMTSSCIMPALLFHSTHLEWHLLVLCQHYYSTPHIWNDIFLYYASTTIPLHTSGMTSSCIMPALLFHSTHLEWHLLVLCQHYYSTPHIWNDIFLYYASTTIPLHTSGMTSSCIMPALLFHSTHLEWHLLVLCQHYYSTPHIWNDIFLYYASTTIPLHTSGMTSFHHTSSVACAWFTQKYGLLRDSHFVEHVNAMPQNWYCSKYQKRYIK